MSDNTEKIRLDQLLVERGHFESRERAQRAIMAGLVFVEGRRAEKAGTRYCADAEVEVSGTERFVGRGGYKLEAALEAFGIDVAGRICLDIGASTGGFTDCLLQRGAARVHAIDVGHHQLHWKIRSDPRVIAQEGVNCRNLSVGVVGERVDLCAIDVSFISLTLILPPAFDLLKSDGHMVALIKPQFELRRNQVAKGGIVTDAALHQAAVGKIRDFVDGLGRQWIAVMKSPIKGASGNAEFLAHLRP